jgi:hypothetical protein
MSKREKITEDQLLAMIDSEVTQAYGYGDGRLEQLRRRNDYYFMGEAKEELAPPEIAGRSRVVDTTVRNTVLGMEGPLMKTFYGSDNIFEFEETKPGLEQQAKTISEYVNYIYRKKNNGYVNTNTWIREALNIKVGILKVWWDPTSVEAREEYTGMTIEQLAMLMDDPEVTLVDQRSYPDEDAQRQKQKALEQMAAQLQQLQAAAQQDPNAAQAYQQAVAQYQQAEAQPVPELFDVTMKRVKSHGKLCIEPVPPEEFLISKRAKSIATAPWCGHRFQRTVAKLRETYGDKVPDDISSDDNGAEFSSERTQREEYLQSVLFNQNDMLSSDPEQREVWVIESYMQVDWDGDGIAEWRKIVKCGRTILANDEFDEPPFVALGSILLPHLFYGLCPADLAIEPQKIKTSLKRGQLDNIYMQVNGRTVAVENQVNLDDLLSNVPGGVVRAKSLNAVQPLQQGIGDIAGSIQLMQIFDDDGQESTGWTRRSQGGNGLQLQQTATQANIVTNREDMRVESISRYMAETGFTELGNMILKLVCKYQKKAEMVKLSGGWQMVDPREWTNQFNLTINVGLGTGNKDQLVQHLMLMGQKQAEGLALGVATPQNIYALDQKLANALGFKNGDQFFTDPAKNPPPPGPQDPSIQVEQMRQQGQMQKIQAEAQQAEAERQHNAEMEQLRLRVEAEARMQIDINKQQAEAEQKALEAQNEAQLDALRQQFEHEREMAKLANEAAQRELDRYKIDQDNATKVLVAQIQAQQKQNAAEMQAQTAADARVTEAGNGDN